MKTVAVRFSSNTVDEVFLEAKYPHCVVLFYRNVFSAVPKSKVKLVAKMLRAIHIQESKKATSEKTTTVVTELQVMKLKEAAKKIADGVEEILTYSHFSFGTLDAYPHQQCH